MWYQDYSSIGGNIFATAVLAILPIVFFLVALTLLKFKGINAAAITVVLQMVIALAVFRMPVAAMFSAIMFGILAGLWPIAWIIVMALWLYKIAVRSSKFALVRSSIASVTRDQRIQVILIAFCFGTFLEGAAAFGTPIAICAAMLVELGFSPLKATCISLTSNVAGGAYGALGIPVLVGAQQGEIEVMDLSRNMIITAQIAAALVPAILVFQVNGFKGLKETIPVWFGCGLLNAGLQCVPLAFIGPELTNIISSLVCMAALVGFMQLWSPSNIYREPKQPVDDLEINPVAAEERPEIELATVAVVPPSSSTEDVENEIAAVVSESKLLQSNSQGVSKLSSAGFANLSIMEIAKAWSPFLLLTLVILLWSMKPFTKLFDAAGPLHMLVLKAKMPGLHLQVVQTPPIKDNVAMAAIWSVTLFNASGTAILIAAILTILTTRRISFKEAGEELWGTLKTLWKAVTLICLIMAVAYVSNFCGGSASIGLALAESGRAFPVISPIIGWLGVFITGSVVNNNVLFARLQTVTASQIGVSPTLLVAANTAGGSMGKAVSPQSIAIAAAAVGMLGQESRILKSVLIPSLLLTLVVCTATVVASFIM